MIFSVYYSLFYGRICHDVPVTCIVWQTEKISEKQPVFKDKSDNDKKVVIVRRTLMWNFMSTTIFCKFWRILFYCIPNSKVYKKTLVKIVKNGQKLCTKSQLLTSN